MPMALLDTCDVFRRRYAKVINALVDRSQSVDTLIHHPRLQPSEQKSHKDVEQCQGRREHGVRPGDRLANETFKGVS
jgi:hypothetical protein